jgi:D-alanyl-D-alanine carboxypeptidase (penicillin-binding protein 5/6)
MRVVHPSVYMKRRERVKRKFKKRRIWYVLVIVTVLAYSSLAFLVTPTYKPVLHEIAREHLQVKIDWPSVGAASIGAAGSMGVLASQAGDIPIPSASTIKLLTALVVLEQKPLGANELGEPIYFGVEDTARFSQTVANGGSAIAIPQDTTITYREALDAVLVDSANNIADKLAIWAFGSVDNYIKAEKNYATRQFLLGTTVTDASGLLPTTKTTPNDMIKIAKLAMGSPAISAVVKQQTATLADGRVIHNTNTLLGIEGIVGLKTGNTDEAGFCLVASKLIKINGRDKLIYSAVFGQPTREVANSATTTLLAEIENGFEETFIASKNQAISSYEAPWGVRIDVTPKSDITIIKWKGEGVSGIVHLMQIKNAKQGDIVGDVEIGDQTFSLILKSDLPSPSIWWRLTHVVDFIREKL